MKYEYMMLDGVKVGISIEDNCSMELDVKEVAQLKQIMKVLRVPFNEVKKEYTIIKESKVSQSAMQISLRQHNKHHEHWYLNVNGNPINHFKGQNIYGSSKAGIQIKKTFMICLAWLSKRAKLAIMASLFAKVEAGKINIHNIEFAAYTNKIKGDIKHLISAWQYMYRASNWRSEKGHLSLDKMLNINSRIDSEEYDNGFALATVMLSAGIKRRIVSLRLYQKTEEIDSKGGAMEPSVRSDIEDRLRVDMELGYPWMMKKKVRTIADLEHYVENNHQGEWKDFIMTELNAVLKQAALIYMWEFPNIFSDELRSLIPIQWFDGIVDEEVKAWALEYGINPRISYKAHVAMLGARLKEQTTGEEFMKSLGSKDKYMELAQKQSEGLNSAFTRIQHLAVSSLSFDSGAVNA